MKRVACNTTIYSNSFSAESMREYSSGVTCTAACQPHDGTQTQQPQSILLHHSITSPTQKQQRHLYLHTRSKIHRRYHRHTTGRQRHDLIASVHTNLTETNTKQLLITTQTIMQHVTHTSTVLVAQHSSSMSTSTKNPLPI